MAELYLKCQAGVNNQMDKLLSVIFMAGVLLLVLPGFLQSNSQLKQFLKNLSIWVIVVLIILIFIFIFK